MLMDNFVREIYRLQVFSVIKNGCVLQIIVTIVSFQSLLSAGEISAQHLSFGIWKNCIKNHLTITFCNCFE